MIQPLKTPKTAWYLYWIDLNEPLPTAQDWFLPTLVIVCDRNSTPVAPPEIMEELDQARVENFLYKLFDQLGTPDKLTVSASDAWENEDWESFSSDCKVEIRFQSTTDRSPDELRTLTQTLVMRIDRGSDSASQVKTMASGLLRTALRMRSQSKRAALLRLALAKDPDFTAARIELADLEFHKSNWKACLTAYQEIIDLDSPRWKGHSVSWWTNAATRPFLRAIYGKAMTQWHLGRYPSAATTLEGLLATNPADNQGARFLIPMLHLLSESVDHASSYFSRYGENYPGDFPEPSFLFGWALCLSLEGREQEARIKYVQGILKNIYLAPMLLEQDEPPRNIWVPNDRAEPNYAAEFVESYAVLWDREPGALRLLREVYQETLPRLEKIVAHREGMSDFQDHRYDPDYKKTWAGLVAADEALTTL